jgi:hypothetical protein
VRSAMRSARRHLHSSVDPLLQVLEDCKLRENPAKDILTRLTLLSLRRNELASLPDALPAGMVHNLRLLDISTNDPLGVLLDNNVFQWHAENIAAFECGWASLQVLGIASPTSGHGSPVSMQATAQELQRLLQRQADAAQPHCPPAAVAFDDTDELHRKLLEPMCKVAEVS